MAEAAAPQEQKEEPAEETDTAAEPAEAAAPPVEEELPAENVPETDCRKSLTPFPNSPFIQSAGLS